MKSKQFLAEIRSIDGLRRAVLKRIEVAGEEVVFHLVTDRSYTREDVLAAENICKKYVPAGYRAGAKVLKSLPSAEAVRRSVSERLAARYPALAAFTSPDRIEVVLDDAGGRFFIQANETDRARLVADGAIDEVAAALCREFCGSWTGEFRFEKEDLGEIVGDVPPPERKFSPRFFPITDYAAIDGAAPERAMYMSDLTKEGEGITLCGKIQYIEERTTKTGKPYFSISLEDMTGGMRCSYFSKKATLERVRSLKAGDSVCITGDNEIFNGGLSFRVKAIDYGAPPEGFVPEARPSLPVPAQYRAVFPVPDSDSVQGAMFGEKPLPASFVKEKFVVFDLETTGLNNNPAAGGQMDRIIEIGAVKIEDGHISEKFTSFVACPVRLTGEIVSLTGITDDMLVGAPEVGVVLADFFRFTDGCILVGHNVQFDIRFVRHYGEEEGYLFEHRLCDTVTFAQSMLRLSNYKLNTVAEHFGFTFNHHRAYDDAFVTAKIFIELVRQKGGLP